MNGTLSWDNVTVSLLHNNRKEKEYPYEIDPIVLYHNSQNDDEKIFENLGLLLLPPPPVQVCFRLNELGKRKQQ